MYPKRRRSAWPTGAPFHFTVPGVQVGEAEDGPHGGRLARPVGAEEADDLAGGNGEREVVEGGERAEAAGQPFELEQAAHLLNLTATAWWPPPAGTPARLRRQGRYVRWTGTFE